MMKIFFHPKVGKAVELLIVVNSALARFLKGRAAAEGLMMWEKKEENRALARFSVRRKTRGKSAP